MDVWNPGKNRWRYKEGSDEKIIEIELTQGKIALIDAERLEEVKKHRWSSTKNHNMFYAKTALKKSEGGYNHIGMHVLLFPEIVAPRDHIDRNGLNNMRSNLRSGANGINMRNRHTKKKDIGIYEKDKLYEAVWKDSLGMTHSRCFSWSLYASKEDAYNAAVVCRIENNDRAIAEISTAMQQKRPIESTAPPAPPPKIGPRYKNICLLYKREKFYRVKADIWMNGKRVSKHFSAYQFKDDKEKAIAAAEVWLDEMRLERQKKRKIEDNNDE